MAAGPNRIHTSFRSLRFRCRQYSRTLFISQTGGQLESDASIGHSVQFLAFLRAYITISCVLFCAGCDQSPRGQSIGNITLKNDHAPLSLKADADSPVALKHHFGYVSPNTEYQHQFTLHNSTDDDLEIVEVQTSCACTVADSFTPVIKGHSDGTIVVKYTSPKVRSDDRKGTTIVTNRSELPYFRLEVTANVRPECSLSVDSVNFDSKVSGDRGIKSVIIENFSQSTWIDLKITKVPDWLSAEIFANSPPAIGGPRQTWQLSLQPSPDLEPQHYRGQVAVRPVLSNPGDEEDLEREVYLAVTAEIHDQIAYSSAQLNLGKCRIPDTVRKCLSIDGTKSNIVVSAKHARCDHDLGDMLKVSFHDVESGRVELCASFSPLKPGVITGHARVWFEDLEQRKTTPRTLFVVGKVEQE